MRDIGNIYAQQTKQRLFIGCLTALISIPVFSCCLVLFSKAVFPALDSAIAAGNTNNSMLVIIIIVLVVLAGLIGIPLMVVTVITLRRNRAFDALFSPFGFTGSTYMLSGRCYKGQFAGREVNIYIYRGPSVEIRIKTRIKTSLQVMPKGSLPASTAGLFNRTPLVTKDPSLEAFSIYPLDPVWTSSLLADHQALEAVRSLMTVGANWAILRRLDVQPDEMTLHLNRSRQVIGNMLDLNSAPAWLSALAILAKIAESQATPEVTTQPVTNISRQSRQKVSRSLVYAIVFIVFVMPMCFIAIGVIAYLIVSL